MYNGNSVSAYNTTGVSVKYLSAPVMTSAVNAEKGIKVCWDKVSGAQGYYLYRKTTGGWTKIATVKGNASVSYVDLSAQTGVKYTYTVKAYNGKITSASKSSVSGVLLNTPELLGVEKVDTGARLVWESVASAENYVVYKMSETWEWLELATVDSTEYIDETVVEGSVYTYTVKAVYKTCESLYNTDGIKIEY